MKKTQTSDILQHLKEGRRLTQKEAINQYGAYRLSAIIHSLRKQGHDIESIPLSVPTRYTSNDGSPRMANIVEYKINNISPAEKLLAEIEKSDENIFERSHKNNDDRFDHRLLSYIKEITDDYKSRR